MYVQNEWKTASQKATSVESDGAEASETAQKKRIDEDAAFCRFGVIAARNSEFLGKTCQQKANKRSFNIAQNSLSMSEVPLDRSGARKKTFVFFRSVKEQ